MLLQMQTHGLSYAGGHLMALTSAALTSAAGACVALMALVHALAHCSGASVMDYVPAMLPCWHYMDT